MRLEEAPHEALRLLLSVVEAERVGEVEIVDVLVPVGVPDPEAGALSVRVELGLWDSERVTVKETVGA